MSRIPIVVLCEGNTEAFFIRDVLAPYMADKNIDMVGARIGNSGHKGGSVSFDRAFPQIVRFLRQRSDWFVTTMFDFYGLGAGWPGLERISPHIRSFQKAEVLEDAVLQAVETQLDETERGRFIPYFSMYEFEGMLFSDVDSLACLVDTEKEHLQAIADAFETPEDINNSPETAPSRRLQALDSAYDKVDVGVTVSKDIGVDNIRAKCPHFHVWLKKLESLAQ